MNVKQFANLINLKKQILGPFVKVPRKYPENFKPGITTPGQDLVPLTRIIYGPHAPTKLGQGIDV